MQIPVEQHSSLEFGVSVVKKGVSIEERIWTVDRVRRSGEEREKRRERRGMV